MGPRSAVDRALTGVYAVLHLLARIGVVAVSILASIGGGITATRAIAGPGHVIYSAVAGYYLGLAKFTPEHRGPLVLKGVLFAAALYGFYNATIGVGPAVTGTLPGISGLGAFLAYVVIFDGVWGLLLVRKLERYRAAYHSVAADEWCSSADDADSAAARSRFQFDE